MPQIRRLRIVGSKVSKWLKDRPIKVMINVSALWRIIKKWRKR